MPIGVITNVLAVIIGGIIGTMIGPRISDRIPDDQSQGVSDRGYDTGDAPCHAGLTFVGDICPVGCGGMMERGQS